MDPYLPAAGDQHPRLGSRERGLPPADAVPVPQVQGKSDRMVVKSGGRLFFLRADEIDWVEAAGNYVRLHVGAESHLLRETMNSIETRLNPDTFFRIHRSRIVNIERIKGTAAVVQR